jgi:hypothetical protein
MQEAGCGVDTKWIASTQPTLLLPVTRGSIESLAIG